MRVALFVVFVSVLTTSSEASNSCMSKTEARQHFGSVHIYWHGPRHCWDATPTGQHRRIHSVQQKIPLHTAQRKIDQPKWHEAMSEMLPNEEPVQSPWVDRWIDIEPPPIDARWVDIAQVGPPPNSRPESIVTPRGVMMVIITIVLMLVIVEILFGGMIYERLESRRNTPVDWTHLINSIDPQLNALENDHGVEGEAKKA